jgi:hypothetical protein
LTDSDFVLAQLRLDAILVRGDFNGNAMLDVSDIDALTMEARSANHSSGFDVDGDGRVNASDRTIWIDVLKKTYFGDSNLDGEFDSGDLVRVFQAGQYEDSVTGNSTWSTGDWNGDGDFNSADFVLAFQDGGYEKGPRAAVNGVPEPSAVVLVLTFVLCCVGSKKRSGCRQTSEGVRSSSLIGFQRPFAELWQVPLRVPLRGICLWFHHRIDRLTE